MAGFTYLHMYLFLVCERSYFPETHQFSLQVELVQFLNLMVVQSLSARKKFSQCFGGVEVEAILDCAQLNSGMKGNVDRYW